MKIKRNVLICAALLLAAFWLQMRFFFVHFTPEAALRDYYLGMFSRVPTVVGEYDGGDARFYFIQDSSLVEGGDFVEVYFAERLGPFWRTRGSHRINSGRQTNPPMEASPVLAAGCWFVYAYKCDAEIEQVSLRLDFPDKPSQELPSAPPYGDVFFWYLPDYFEIDEELALCTYVFTAYDKDGAVLTQREI